MAKFERSAPGRQDRQDSLPVADKQLASLNAINQAKSVKNSAAVDSSSNSATVKRDDMDTNDNPASSVCKTPGEIKRRSREPASTNRKAVNTASETLTFRMPGYVKDRIRSYVEEVHDKYDSDYNIRSFFFEALETFNEAYPEFGEGMVGDWPISRKK